jgi:hypothetical protein
MDALRRLPHPDQVKAPSPIAQWWRSSPMRVAPPRLMINACARSYACLNRSVSQSKRAINMTATATPSITPRSRPTVARSRGDSRCRSMSCRAFRLPNLTDPIPERAFVSRTLCASAHIAKSNGCDPRLRALAQERPWQHHAGSGPHAVGVLRQALPCRTFPSDPASI